MKRKLLIFLSCLLLLSTSSCVTNHVRCPQFTAKKSSAPHYTASRHVKSKQRSEPSAAQAPKQDDSGMQGIGIGGLAGSGSGLELKIPKMFARKMSYNDINETNRIYSSASDNRVMLVKRGHKLFLKAKSVADITSLSKVIAKKPGGAGGGGIALAAGILGIIAFVLAFGPYANFLAIVLAIIAIILGIVGLSSGRVGWALIGIIFGILALLVAGVFIGIVYIRFY